MASTDTPGSPRPPRDSTPPTHEEFLNEQSGISAEPSDDWQRRRSGKQLVRQAGKVGDRLPAAFDENRNRSGRFVPGHSVRSGGPRKRLTHKQIWERALASGGTPLMRKLAAHALGLSPDSEEIPDDLETAHEFHVWVMTHKAVFSLDAFREIYDRLDPKPQRITLDATLTARRAPISGSLNASEAAEAEAYMTELHDPESADVEPEEYEPEDDLSFLE